jgi:predicted hydrocarbon binding protein
MRRFVETLAEDLGLETFIAVLEKAGLPAQWTDREHFARLSAEQSAEVYSNLQAALRTYYGRGARSILVRIGGKLWGRLLDNGALGLKAQATVVRGLPVGMRRKPALEMLARLMSAKPGDITVHTLDLDLLFVDHASAATLKQSEQAPICFVSLGLVRECLFWAVGHEHDIEEISCRARGAKECEFKITVGG